MNIFQYEREIAGIILSGRNVAFDPERAHFDDRLLQKHIINIQSKSCDVAVIGSSTTMQIRSTLFPQQSFFNYSLRRGVLEDYFALFQLLRAQNRLPAYIILGVDPWLFDPQHWKTYYLPLCNELNILNREWDLRLPAKISFRQWMAYQREIQFKRICRMMDIAWRRTSFASTDSDIADEYIRRHDGSTGYHAPFRERNSEEIADIIRQSVHFPHYVCDELYLRAFQKFLEKAREYKVQISLYFPPYHPEVYRLSHGNKKGQRVVNYEAFMANMAHIENELTNFAPRLDISIKGSFDSRKLEATDSDFLDWMHSKESFVEKCLRFC
ncbi:MAG: hypothetical protein ACOY3I_00665 [Verrucomicrobiota bacterium]